MTSSVSLSVGGEVKRPACLALADLSVKSVDRIEVTRQPQQATAATIALARIVPGG